MVYAQTRGFCWDEGFHLLAARLIREGKRPYLDFCFPQTPLNAYLNAGWMSVFGESWRSTHVLATILLSIAIFLTADFVFRRFGEVAEKGEPFFAAAATGTEASLCAGEWKLPAAVFSAVLFVSVFDVVAFATAAQAYAIAVLLTLASFRFACAGARNRRMGAIFAAGLCASASAACTMLAAAAVPVILAWCVIENRRWKTAVAFVAGAAIPWTPVVWLFAEGPRQVWFNIIQYQTLYRGVNWGDVAPHDMEVFLGAAESPPGLMLMLLGAAGIVFAARRGDRVMRMEYYLSAAIALAIGMELSIARPTFDRYFLLTVPFLAIPAAEGLFIAGSRLYRSDRPWAIVAATSALAVFGLANQLFGDRDAIKWPHMEEVARKVKEVTPASAPLYADELTYFLTRHAAPPGMEFSYSHKLELPAAEGRTLHILSQAQVDEMVKRKAFKTFESCDEDDMERLKPESLYADHADLEDCKVFWNLR